MPDENITPAQEISKEFLLRALDKVDHYWNFLLIGLVAFIGWLLATDATFTTPHRITATVGYLCFAAMNFCALRSAYRAVESASQDFSSSISGLNLPGVTKLAKSRFGTKYHPYAVIGIHLLMGSLILTAIWQKGADAKSPTIEFTVKGAF